MTVGAKGQGMDSGVGVSSRASRGQPSQRLVVLLAFLAIFVAVGASGALADETGEAPGPPTPVEMQEGLSGQGAAIHEIALTDPRAAEELPREDLTRAQALNLLEEVFDPLLQTPAGIFDDLEVQQFLSNNAAIISSGSAPEPTSDTIGAPPEESYEGPVLLESTAPLRTESESGQAEAVDLGLEYSDGTLQPSNPLTEVEIPQQLGEGVELPQAGVRVELQDAPVERRPSTIDQSVAAYPEVAEDTSLAIAATPGGFETLTLLQSPDAPTSQTFVLDLPQGATLRATNDGGAEVLRDDHPLLGISPPTALDAVEESVPVTMTVSGKTLTLEVAPEAETTWPVLVDPLYETYNWWNGITGLGGWKGHTTLSPAYYVENKATCTSYASPYSCQSGVTANAPGLYIAELPAPAPVNASAGWTFRVPRWDEEWQNNNRPPDSFISNLTFEHVGFWHRTDAAPQPSLWTGIWNTVTPGWVAGNARSGAEADWTDTKLVFNAGQNTHGKEAAFHMSNLDGHDLTAVRDAFVNTAVVTIGDTKAPAGASVTESSKWLDQAPAEPITATFSDTGLGVYRFGAYSDGVPPQLPSSGQWKTQTVGSPCTTVFPCPGTKTFTLKPAQGENYDPAALPQGYNYVNLYAEDVLGNKSGIVTTRLKVDHSNPSLTLSGSLTEQDKLGTTAPEYTLKYEARDGDHDTPSALTPFGGAGPGPGQLQRPQGIAVDPGGNIWVVDRNNNRVQKFDPTGKFLLQFGGFGEANGQFNDPRGIAISKFGTVWVSDIGNKRVQAFNSDGEYLRKITTGLVMPYGLATGPAEVIWVSDPGTGQVSKFSGSGAFIEKVRGTATSPTGSADLYYPVGLATDKDGNLWVADSGNSKIKKYSSNGSFLTQFGTTGIGAGQLKLPLYIAIAPSGNLLITEELTNRVQVFQPNGVFLRQFGSAGAGNDQLTEARGIAMGQSNTALVADAGNHRIVKWSHMDLDQQSGVASTEVKVDGQLVEPKYEPGCETKDCAITREWTLKAQDFTTGKHEVEVTATDGVGRSVIKSLTVSTVRDETPPQLSTLGVFFTAPEGWVQQKTYGYWATATDAGGDGVTSITLKIDDNVVKSMNQSCPSGGCNGSLLGSVNMAAYKGGAHPAELTVADRAGNITEKAWTINVNPAGGISATEAAETLDAVDTTSESEVVMPTAEALDPEQIQAGDDPGLEEIGSELVSTGTQTTTAMGSDLSQGFTITSPEGDTTFDPDIASGTGAVIAGEVTGVAANIATSVDIAIRPQFNGTQVFSALRSSESRETFSWTVTLGKDQSLVSVNSNQAQVIYDDGKVSFLITAEEAHDATGKSVPTSLSVNGSTLTLTVHHRSSAFIYPVVAGQAFETGYESVTVYMPPPPGGGEVTPPPNPISADLAKAFMEPWTVTVRVPAPAPCTGEACASQVRYFDLKSYACSGFFGCGGWKVWFEKGRFYRSPMGTGIMSSPALECRSDVNDWWTFNVNLDLIEVNWHSPYFVKKNSGQKLIAYCKYDISVFPIPEIGDENGSYTLVNRIYPNGFQETIVKERDPWIAEL
jgi:NHL repeat